MRGANWYIEYHTFLLLKQYSDRLQDSISYTSFPSSSSLMFLPRWRNGPSPSSTAEVCKWCRFTLIPSLSILQWLTSEGSECARRPRQVPLGQAAPDPAVPGSCQQDSIYGSWSAVYTVALVFPPNQMNWARRLLRRSHSVNRGTSGRMRTLSDLKAQTTEMSVENLTALFISFHPDLQLSRAFYPLIQFYTLELLRETASVVFWSEFLTTERRCIVFAVRYELNLYMLCRGK
jgi:hypothetical protein